MRSRYERLDEKLGDFGPLSQPIDQIQLERLLDRYGIALVHDYPQILFEHHDQMRLPGWRYREFWQEYPNWRYEQPLSPGQGQVEPRIHAMVGMVHAPETDRLTRLCAAYRVLDDIFAPVPREPSYGPRPGRNGYGRRARPGYS